MWINLLILLLTLLGYAAPMHRAYIVPFEGTRERPAIILDDGAPIKQYTPPYVPMSLP